MSRPPLKGWQDNGWLYLSDVVVGVEIPDGTDRWLATTDPVEVRQ